MGGKLSQLLQISTSFHFGHVTSYTKWRQPLSSVKKLSFLQKYMTDFHFKPD